VSDYRLLGASGYTTSELFVKWSFLWVVDRPSKINCYFISIRGSKKICIFGR
jgi:hypothetical protein